MAVPHTTRMAEGVGCGVPTYDDLPPVDGMPRGCVRGVFEKDGKKDLFETLNHLTTATIKAAAAEVQDGCRFHSSIFNPASIAVTHDGSIQMVRKWPLDALEHIPPPGRRKLAHRAQPSRYRRLRWNQLIRRAGLQHPERQPVRLAGSLAASGYGSAQNRNRSMRQEMSHMLTLEHTMPTLK
ncbi:conserved hypothetical protein [Verticillium alfalfae VaMs.102]|uniref:Uncharacterized protein n=1 Tax=Verticillium alfalfae (strain VaMs.102 / ATCC MYA-4576 / FGSC 10136) TaxID=526221 RepID=C9SAE6_VERA1|nr:conserved hypothetical protein [Verticillium alfalfae VaMs.102]EEY16314.1 conserved hypothetical protein [Verticillium alfalfae VaMs.102]